MKNRPEKYIIPCVLNLTVCILVFASWIYMMFFGSGKALSAAGHGTLRYYTVLSNLLEGAVSAVAAVVLVRASRQKSEAPRYLVPICLISAGAVSVTFSVVVLFLGPLYGYGSMYLGANLFFHLAVPLLSAFKFIFMLPAGRVELRHMLFSPAPTLLYGTVYLLNVVINGPEGNDIYGFANWGIGWGVLIFAVILALNLALAFVLGLLHNAAVKRKKKPGIY